MEDTENALPPSKKRAAGRELSRDNPGLDDEEDASEQETGTFKRASDEVLAGRRIVKVRRHQSSSAPSSNPFAGIRLVSTTKASMPPAEVMVEAQAARGKTVSEDVVGKNDAETEEGKGENDMSESKINEPEVESAPEKEEAGENSEAAKPEADGEQATVGDKNENGDKNDNGCESVAKGKTVSEDVVGKNDSETEEGKGENDLSESKINEPEVESAPDKEDAGENSEAAKPEADGEQATVGDKNENGDKNGNGCENVDSSAEGTSLNSFQQLSSSQNAFTGLAGTGFSSSTFSFGTIPKDGSAFGASSGAIFRPKNDQSSPFFGLPNNGNSSLFGTPGASSVTKSEGSGLPTMQEVPVETGEENEKAVFTADSVLFEYIDGGWKERGKGELKVNVSTTGTDKARLVMRARGNYRLILNASLYRDMKLTNMDKKGITFACMNSAGEGKDGLSTFALKFKDGSIVDEFRAAVAAHEGKTSTILKTPENSPKASDD